MVGSVYQQQQRQRQQQTKKMSSPASTISGADDDDYSDDNDSQYASFMDNDSLQNSDDDYMPPAASAQKHNNGRQTFAERSAAPATTSAAKATGSAVQRMPTRRPNPSIHNRNALMARENRKKKKEHVQTLERDVDELRTENDALRKLLQKRSTMVHRLRDERLYLKSIIANKTSIMSLLQTIRGNRLPLTSSAMSFVVAGDEEEGGEEIASNQKNVITTAAAPKPQTDSPIAIDDLCNNDYDTGLDYMMMPTPPQSLSPSSPSAAASLTDSSVSPLHDMAFPDLPWDEDMCAEDARFFVPRLSSSETDTVDEEEEEEEEGEEYGDDSDDDTTGSGEKTTAQAPHRTKVSHEHNYSNNHINEQPRSPPPPPAPQSSTTTYYSTAEHLHRGGKVRPTAYATTAPKPAADASAPGICLHLSGGRVSLEFCSSCHRHAQNAWDEEE